MEGFAEDIRRSLGDAAKGVSDIFLTIAAQQKRDYDLAENALSNIEALKKNISIYGEQEITAGANNLVKDLSASISKNGKLDYAKLGQLRKSVSDIADLKRGYDVFEKQFDKYVQFGATTKDKLVSFEKYYKDLIGLSQNKELMKNPSDLAYQMGEVYNNNYDFVKAGASNIAAVLPTETVSGTIKKGDGSEETYKGKAFQGVTIDPATGKPVIPQTVSVTDANGNVTQVPFYQNLAEKMKARDPEFFQRFRAQQQKNNPLAVNMTDEDIAKTAFNTVPAADITPVSIKSSREVKSEENTIKTQEGNLKWQDKFNKQKYQHGNLQNQLLNESILTKQSEREMYTKVGAVPADYGIAKEGNTTHWTLPNQFVTPIDLDNGQTKDFKVQRISYDATKKRYEIGGHYVELDPNGQVKKVLGKTTMSKVFLPVGQGLQDSQTGASVYGKLQNLISKGKGKTNRHLAVGLNTFQNEVNGGRQAAKSNAPTLAEAKAALAAKKISQAEYNQIESELQQ